MREPDDSASVVAIIDMSGLRLRRSADPSRHEVTVAIGGEVDLASERLLRAELEAALECHPRSLVIDAGDLSFIDLRGVSALAAGARRMASTGGNVVLRSPSGMLLRLLRFTDDLQWFRVES